MNYFFPFSDWGVCVTRFYTRLVCFGFILFNSLFVHMKWLAEFVFTFHLFRVPRLIYEGSVSSGSWWCDIWLIIFFPQSSYFRFSLKVVWSSAFAIWLESYKWANYCFTNAMDLQIFPCCYLLCLHCAVIGFFQMAPPFQVLSNKVKLVFVGVLLFKFIFIKSWNFNRNENGEASPWCLGLLWDTRWVSVLVVIFPAKLFFYRRVIDGSASFGDTCKHQMASVSRRFLCF